jgi:hypothetical protein
MILTYPHFSFKAKIATCARSSPIYHIYITRRITDATESLNRSEMMRGASLLWLWRQIQDADVLNSSACRLDMIDSVTSRVMAVGRSLYSRSFLNLRQEMNTIRYQDTILIGIPLLCFMG